MEKCSGYNINSSFQKCLLGKKCNLNDIFHGRKGHFAPGKRALWKTRWGACPSPTTGAGNHLFITLLPKLFDVIFGFKYLNKNCKRVDI
jgi:hypothetical protein